MSTFDVRTQRMECPERPQRPNTGGPASHASLRDHFAARAPEVPDWFQIPLPQGLSITQALKQQPGYQTLSMDDIELLRAADNEGDLELACLPGRLHVIAAAANKASSEACNARWKAQQDEPERRFFAWRWYYADQMLKHREGA